MPGKGAQGSEYREFVAIILIIHHRMSMRLKNGENGLVLRMCRRGGVHDSKSGKSVNTPLVAVDQATRQPA